MITLSVRGLPGSATEQSVENLFSEFGAVHSLTVVRDLFTGRCRGFASVKMEGHEARLAIASLNNRQVDGSLIRVERERPGFGSVKKRR